ncbi:MAG: 4-hydroxybenzoate octaprenyltransferase [Sphingomonadaceae bacterium]
MAGDPDSASDIVPDSERRGLIGALPRTMRPYASLMRLDRPIGTWLLFWPCAWGVALAGMGPRGLELVVWLALGAFAMRSAGCVYNDIVDRELDARVERTRLRPLASRRVPLAAAWALLVALSLGGLIVLFQLKPAAQLVALASLALVAAYPFMKRITWWPQAWLGLVFAWGAPVGWTAVTGALEAPGLLLYAGTVSWVIGYDTVYALQDRDDDALIGIKSSALALGRDARAGIALLYVAALVLWSAALWTVYPHPLALVALLPAAVHLLFQLIRLRLEDGASALAVFRANRFTGLLVFLACLVVGTA